MPRNTCSYMSDRTMGIVSPSPAKRTSSTAPISAVRRSLPGTPPYRSRRRTGSERVRVWFSDIVRPVVRAVLWENVETWSRVREDGEQFGWQKEARIHPTTTHRIHLLRHAKSSWDDPSLADHDRPLAPRGRRATARIR